jgi:riboflavin biosynthesis pyrimidine reductase
MPPPADEVCEVIVTAPDPDWLVEFTRRLVTDRLCASGHNFAPIRTIYRWHGQVRWTTTGVQSVRAVLLEGGPTLAGSFPAAGLIDQVVAYIAPVLIGGGGKPALAGPGAVNIADAKRFQLDDVVRIGPDVRLTATPLR